MGPYERLSKSRSRGYTWVKTSASKIAANDLCEPITKLFNLMATEGPVFMDYQPHSHDLQLGERHSLGNYRIIMLAKNNLWQALWLCFRK